MQEIGDETGLVFDVMLFPLGLGALSSKTSVKAGQYVIRERAVSNNNIYRGSKQISTGLLLRKDLLIQT